MGSSFAASHMTAASKQALAGWAGALMVIKQKGGWVLVSQVAETDGRQLLKK